MHGTVYANYAVDKVNLLLAFGFHFDDRVTDKLDSFASRAILGSEDLSSTQQVKFICSTKDADFEEKCLLK